MDPWQGIEGDAESRGAALLRVLAHEEETVALVFADDKRDSFGALLATLEARLGEEWAVLALQSAMGSAQRTRVMRAFREAPAPRVLLASDVASRGLDVPDITHVVNYDRYASHHEIIEKAFSLKKIKAVAITINSPGGSGAISSFIFFN